MRRQQAGFTLVEIAIVLVIIGLLLGGILKGQEMITSAKVRNLADQGNAVKAAFFAFQDRYRALPGDYLQATTNLPAGAGTVANGNGNAQVAAGAESGQVWLHLARAGFLSGSFDGGAAANTQGCVATTCPPNAFSGTATLMFASNSNGTTASTHEIGTGANIPVGVIAELDRKVDDGAPNAGAFQFDATSTAACINAGAWNVAVANAQTNCSGIHRL